MGKHISKLATLTVVGALALTPIAGASSGKYKIPPPKGGNGTTKKPTKGIAGELAGKTGKELAKGFKIKVRFPKAGKITCTVSHSGKKIGGGSATATKAGKKSLKISFTSSGKKFLLGNSAGQKITVKCTFKPKKKGKSVSSSVSVKLG